MLYPQTTPAQKRLALREMLRSGRICQFPGAYTPISAKLIQQKGYDGVYISGAVLANELGFPDIGLSTLTEVAARAGQIARMTDLPAIVDADTGFGEPMNVARTVQELEDAGLAGCHIEDQFNPKRCGHLDNKNIVDDQTAVQRIKAAVEARRDERFLIMARTDLRGVEGLEAAILRMQQLVEAGADAIFPEAMTSLEEFDAVRSAVDVPILANMTEFGKSRLYAKEELAAAGVNLIIYPVTLLRASLGAMERVLETIAADGSQEAQVDQMLTRQRLYELVDYEGYSQFDSGIFDFEVPDRFPG